MGSRINGGVMRKKAKRKNKTIIPFWWAEILVLVVIGILFATTLRMEWKFQYVQEFQSENKMWTYVISQDNGIYGEKQVSEEQLRKFLHEVMRYIPSIYVQPLNGRSGYVESRTGFAARFVDEDGNVIIETRPRNIHVEYDDYSDKVDGKQWFEMTDYFPEEEVDAYLENYKKYYDSMETTYLKGYRQVDGSIIPTEIGYQVSRQMDGAYKTTSYSIISDMIPPEGELVNVANFVDYGDLSIDVYNMDPSQNDKAFQWLEQTQDWYKQYTEEDFEMGFARGLGSYGESRYEGWRMHVGGGGVYGTIIYSAPLIKLCLTAPHFWMLFGVVAAVLQIGILVVYIQYWDLLEKRKQMDLTRNTFINAMAHEMKTPAAVIKNGTECIKENIYPEKQDHYLDMISDEAEHMNGLLEQMLMYTRTSDGVYQLNQEKFELSDLVKDVCRSYQILMANKGMQLQIEEHDAGVVSADKSLIRMVIDNFVSNAVKYGEDFGVINIIVKESSCSVYNSGSVISEMDLEKIWEPLYVTDPSRTKREGSSGMGLAIAKNILELHGAAYGAEALEDGVRFYFEL